MQDLFKVKILKTLAAQLNVDFAEELFPILQAKGRHKNSIWHSVPSKFFGKRPAGLVLTYTQMYTLYKKRGLDCVKEIFNGPRGYHEQRVNYYLALHKNAGSNMEKVLGYIPRNLCRSLTSRDYKAWSVVSRGRDLFIPGMGSFNIPATLEILQKDDSPWRQGMQITSIQAIGYFQDSNAELLLQSPVWRRHLVRYKKSWTKDLLGHSFDYTRLDLLGDIIEDGSYLRMSPAKLYKLIEKRKEDFAIKQAAAYKDINKAFPEVKSFKEIRGLGTQFAENFTDLQLWGSELGTCIGSKYYAAEALTGISEFWKFSYKKEVLVGQYLVKTNKIKQLTGKGNKAPSKEAKQMITTFLTKGRNFNA